MEAGSVQPDPMIAQVMKLTGEVGGLAADVKTVIGEISGAREQLERGANRMESMENRIDQMDTRINGRITKAQQTADTANGRASEALRQVHALATVTRLWHRLKHSKLALAFAVPIATAAGAFFGAKFF